MKKFVKNIFLFFLLILAFFVFENVMSGFYSDFKRPGSNLFYDTFYYPNENDPSYVVEEELSRVPRETNLVTDDYGNRNNKIYEDLDIMLCGDSFSSLVMLRQDETIHQQINDLSNLRANSIRVKGVFGFDNNLNYISSRYAKPKLLVYEIVERNLPVIFGVDTSKTFHFNREKEFSDWKAVSGIKKFINEGLDLPTLRYFQYELLAEAQSFPRSKIDKNLYFLEGESAEVFSDAQISRIADQLQKMHKLTENNGIHFVFLPIPNKETIYYSKVPLPKRPDNLDRLYVEMDKRGIPYINVLGKLLDSKEQTYLRGDSHVNPHGSFLIASQVIDYYNSAF